MANVGPLGRRSCAIYGSSATGYVLLSNDGYELFNSFNSSLEMAMSKPIKRSVAVLIRNGDRILAIRRADDDDELPGIWGLPAGTGRGSETPEEVITRIGREKLGVRLVPISILSSGMQERALYRLEMDLWEAQMEGTPACPEWRWAALDVLRPGAAAGSLCCELALRS